MAKAKNKAEKIAVIQPSKIGVAVRQLYEQKQIAQGHVHPTWEQLDDLSQEIGRWVGQMAEDIHSSVELVKQHGCEHMKEFNAAVIKTNEDFVKFMADYDKLRASHAGKTGTIEHPDDLALSIQIYENYMQFRAFFEGVMHHSLISFTEYALEAKDRYVAQLSDQEIKEYNENLKDKEEVKDVE